MVDRSTYTAGPGGYGTPRPAVTWTHGSGGPQPTRATAGDEDATAGQRDDDAGAGERADRRRIPLEARVRASELDDDRADGAGGVAGVRRAEVPRRLGETGGVARVRRTEVLVRGRRRGGGRRRGHGGRGDQGGGGEAMVMHDAPWVGAADDPPAWSRTAHEAV